MVPKGLPQGLWDGSGRKEQAGTPLWEDTVGEDEASAWQGVGKPVRKVARLDPLGAFQHACSGHG